MGAVHRAASHTERHLMIRLQRKATDCIGKLESVSLQRNGSTVYLLHFIVVLA